MYLIPKVIYHVSFPIRKPIFHLPTKCNTSTFVIYRTFPFFDILLITSYILYPHFIVKLTFPVLFTSHELPFILSVLVYQLAFPMKLSILVEGPNICSIFYNCHIPLIVISTLDPSQRSLDFLAGVISAFKLIIIPFLLAFTFEHISLEFSFVDQIFWNILSIDSISLVCLHIAVVVGSIGEDIMARPVSSAVLKLPHKNRTIMKIHSAVALWLVFLRH